MALQGASAQKSFPTISARTYTTGSAVVTVTGSFSYTADIPINKEASTSDGEMTWLQFGASGSSQPNALLTFNAGSNEVGISASRGLAIATGGFIAGQKSDCSGTIDVKPNLIEGHYTCRELTSYDPGTRKMGTVNVDVKFKAGS
jgi:hypothetical protein